MPIIKNYGLRWIRDQVNWGSKGSAGALSGRLAKNSDPVDFRDQIGIYILYEPIFNPIYIGQAGFGNATMLQRLKHHRNDHLRDRWTHFSWFGFRSVNQDKKKSLSAKQNSDAKTSLSYGDALDEVEGILIEVLEPRLNKQGAKWQKTADEYIQAGLPPGADRLLSIEEQLAEIRDLLRKPPN